MKLLSIDYGTKRIGLAIGESDNITVAPYGMIENKGNEFVISEIKKICADEDIEKIIIGVPMHACFKKQADIIENFITAFKNEITIGIDMIDEAFTTKIAGRDERYANLMKDRNKGWKDMLAAVEILRGYLENLKCKNQKSK